MNSLPPSPDRDARAVAAGFIDARARTEFFVMCLAAFLFSLSHNYSALFAIVFEKSGHSLQSTGWLLTLFAIPAIAGALLSSALCARLGVLTAARFAYALTALGIGSLVLTRDDFTLALLSRIIQGIGVGAAMPVGMVYIQSRINRTQFVYFITVYSAVIPLAAAFAPPLGEWTLARWGMNAFFIEAAIPAALGVALTSGLRDAPRPQNAGGLNLGSALRIRLALIYIVIFTGGGLYGYSVSYLAASLQERAIALAAFFVPSSIALVAIRFVGMRALAQISPPKLIVASLLLYALAYVCLWQAQGQMLALTGGVLFGLGNAIMFPVTAAWVGEGLEPSQRAGPQAVNTASFYTGMYALPWPQTFAIAAFGYAVIELAWAMVALALAASVYFLRALARR